jgi:hypothetical protein
MIKVMPYRVQPLHKLAALPITLLFRRNLSAREVLIRYLLEPESFFRGIASRQAVKVRNALQVFQEKGISSPSVIADELLDRIRVLRERPYRPFFVMGAGGSGSTWLGALLGDLAGFCYAGEVYTPLAIYCLYKFRKSPEINDLIWAVMLLPSWAATELESPFNREFVNSGRSIARYAVYRQVWSKGRFVFLVRDPRDQVLSITYRKRSYRDTIAPGIHDLAYLKYNARKYMRIYRAFAKVRGDDIYLLRYEDLLKNTRGEVTKLLAWAQVDLPDRSLLSRVIDRHDAAKMRAGEVVWRGNLDEGGKAEGWRELMTQREKNLVKPILQEAVEGLGYEWDGDGSLE